MAFKLPRYSELTEEQRVIVNLPLDKNHLVTGAPGTGKTQTILNIISNLIIKGKSVLVVSNNNSATQNVLEKLSKKKYGMNFLVASLGSVDNKDAFINNQSGTYPDLSSWSSESDSSDGLHDINEITDKLKKVYCLKETIAKLKEQRYEVDLESNILMNLQMKPPLTLGQ